MDTRPFCARESRFMTDIGHLSSVAGQSSVTPSKSPAARKKRLSPHERLHQRIAFRTPSDPGIVVAPASLRARTTAPTHPHGRARGSVYYTRRSFSFLAGVSFTTSGLLERFRQSRRDACRARIVTCLSVR